MVLCEAYGNFETFITNISFCLICLDSSLWNEMMMYTVKV
jgi:hypothetical protein